MLGGTVELVDADRSNFASVARSAFHATAAADEGVASLGTSAQRKLNCAPPAPSHLQLHWLCRAHTSAPSPPRRACGERSRMVGDAPESGLPGSQAYFTCSNRAESAS